MKEERGNERGRGREEKMCKGRREVSGEMEEKGVYERCKGRGKRGKRGERKER